MLIFCIRDNVDVIFSAETIRIYPKRNIIVFSEVPHVGVC